MLIYGGHIVDIGLLDALNNLTKGLDGTFERVSCDEFDLKRYETIQRRIHQIEFPIQPHSDKIMVAV